jgi:hypothetical protein
VVIAAKSCTVLLQYEQNLPPLTGVMLSHDAEHGC